jgi:hypothetical protein
LAKKRFDEGDDEITDCIVDILTKYSEEAFTAKELAKGLDTPIINVLVALLNLTGKGVVKGKFVGLNYYYMRA